MKTTVTSLMFADRTGVSVSMIDLKVSEDQIYPSFYQSHGIVPVLPSDANLRIIPGQKPGGAGVRRTPQICQKVHFFGVRTPSILATGLNNRLL